MNRLRDLTDSLLHHFKAARYRWWVLIHDLAIAAAGWFMAYWLAFNDHQLELGGDPFVGAKLGNLMLALGYRDITTKVRNIHLDNRAPGERAEFLAFWTELLLSGAPGLVEAGKVSEETVNGMKDELGRVAHDPNAVFFYSFIQARGYVL